MGAPGAGSFVTLFALSVASALRLSRRRHDDMTRSETPASRPPEEALPGNA